MLRHATLMLKRCKNYRKPQLAFIITQQTATVNRLLCVVIWVLIFLGSYN